MASNQSAKPAAAAKPAFVKPDIKTLKVKFSKHPIADYIEISEPFTAFDEIHGEKIARIYKYNQGINAPHKYIPKGEYEIGSEDGITLLNVFKIEDIAPVKSAAAIAE